MSQKFAWSQLVTEKLSPVLSRRMLTAGNITMAQLEMKKGAIVPRHEHPNEQISCVMRGSLLFWLGEKAGSDEDRDAITVAAGEVLAIPGHVPHRVRAVEDSMAMDIFNPPRADWLSGKDSYLRSAPGASA